MPNKVLAELFMYLTAMYLKLVRLITPRDFPHIWHELGVLLTFESDWKKAKKILEEIIERTCRSTI